MRILNGLHGIPHYKNPIRSSHNMTVEHCAETCRNLNFTVAGLQQSTLCFCGSQTPLQQPLPSPSCDMMCSGNASQACGGVLTNSVYKLAVEKHDKETVTPPNQSVNSQNENDSASKNASLHSIATIVSAVAGSAVVGLGLLLFAWRQRSRRRQQQLRRVPSSPVLGPPIRRSHQATLERASTMTYNRIRGQLTTPPLVHLPDESKPSSVKEDTLRHGLTLAFQALHSTRQPVLFLPCTAELTASKTPETTRLGLL